MDRKLSDTRKMSITTADDRFDRVMEKVGYRGKFQSRFSFAFNFVLVILITMAYFNIILALAVPDHWCHVPGRDTTNYTIEEWKTMTLPKEYDTKGMESPSKCKMYNVSLDNISSQEFNASGRDIIECQYGWDFDQTWYTETAPSQGVWVCEKQIYVSNAFAFAKIGDVVGTCIFGQLGDTLGRRPVFFLTLTILIVGRILCAFSANYYHLFLFAVFLGSIPTAAVFQSPYIVSMEISEKSNRAHVAMLQSMGWTTGICLIPFLLWTFGHWFQFTLATILPCIIFLFSSRWMIESPRWLANQGKTARCIRQLERIASVNGTTVPSDAMITLSKHKHEDTEKAFGIYSLFTNWRLAKNTVILLICCLGRRPVFFLTLTILIVGRILCAFSANYYHLFLFAVFLGSIPTAAVFQSPYIVSMEISEKSNRAHVAMLQSMGWTTGICLIPFLLWTFGHWFQFTLATILPCIIFLFSSRWMIESPRWLANQGKTARCIRQLERIASVNGTTVPSDAMITLSKHKHEDTEKAFGIYSLFTNWRLAKNTVILLICWINAGLIYYVIIINVNTLQGNPFMNFFWQGLAELPAYVLAKYACDKFGRRWTQVAFYFIGGLGCILMAYLIAESEMENIVTLLSAFIKFCICFVYYGTKLQTVEIYPTCVRQSGMSLCGISGSIFAIFGPYIVYLGTSYDACYPPIVLAFLAFTGAVAAAFLPETLHEKLPETLADAQKFGKHQKFWSLPHKKVETAEST